MSSDALNNNKSNHLGLQKCDDEFLTEEEGYLRIK